MLIYFFGGWQASNRQVTVVPESFVRQMVGLERLRNMVLRSQNANLIEGRSFTKKVGFDKWRGQPPPAVAPADPMGFDQAIDELGKENRQLRTENEQLELENRHQGAEIYELRFELWAERHARCAAAAERCAAVLSVVLQD